MSVDGERRGEIEVYVPAPVANQYVAAGDPVKEAAAERALHSLRGARALQPLATILLRSEGIASSRIEGEVASARRVFEADYASDVVADRQAQPIVNSIRVMTDAVTQAGRGVKSQDLNRWHALLFQGSPARFEPGMLRKTQNWIGIRTDTPVGADFVPAPPEIVAEALEDLVTFANRVDVAPVTQAAVSHAQFESIHPYPDGNGRIGRVLVYRCWAYRGLTDAINPPISQALVENRAAYIDGLTAYRDGDVDRWLDFFFEVVQSAVSYTHALGRELEALTEEWLERLAGTHEDALVRRLVAELSANPILSASEVAAGYDVTERGARSALDDLVQRGILTFRSLRKAKRGRPTKVYEAAELFAMLDLSARDLA
ncbi:MAG: Fic family protein [Acidimicrobiia bacterium]